MGGCGGGLRPVVCLSNPSLADCLGEACWTRMGGAWSLKGEALVFDCGDTATYCAGENPCSATE